MLTVAFPIYRSSQIAWLAFEGLCRQKDSPPFELLICEENHWDSCAEKYIKEFKDRLIEANCVKIKLVQPDKWIQLVTKWRLMGEIANKKSIGFVLQAADCYPHPFRLSQTQIAIDNGADWYNENDGYFFDLWIKKMIRYNHKLLNGNAYWKTGLNMAFRTKYARNIPKTYLNAGIDNFLFQHCITEKSNLNVVFEKPLGSGVDTNSANNISKFRLNKFLNPSIPFEPTEKNISTINLPVDIVEKLTKFELKYTNHNYVAMKKYRFVKTRNHFKKGEVHELSDVVASLYLKEGIVENIDMPVEVNIKEEKQEYSTKEDKLIKSRRTKKK